MNLQQIYDQILQEFDKEYNESGELSMHSLNKWKFEERTTNEGLYSKYYILKNADDYLQIHNYSYDRCRAFQINPDGNRVTITLSVAGKKTEKIYSWLDKR